MRRSTILLGVAIVLLAASIPTVGANAVANGRLAFVASEAGQPQVFTINTDGSGRTRVTDRPDGAGEYGLSWAPESSSLLVVLSASRDIMYTMRPDDGTTTVFHYQDTGVDDHAFRFACRHDAEVASVVSILRFRSNTPLRLSRRCRASCQEVKLSLAGFLS